MRIQVLRCFAVSLLAAGCLGGISRDEVARSHAPSGRVDAVLVETNGGATTSFGYQVHVVPAGQEPRSNTEVVSLYAAVRNDSAYGANLRWEDSTLVVEYLEARDARLTRPAVLVGGHRVRTILRAGIRDAIAPAGGMLYSLHHKPRPD